MTPLIGEGALEGVRDGVIGLLHVGSPILLPLVMGLGVLLNPEILAGVLLKPEILVGDIDSRARLGRTGLGVSIDSVFETRRYRAPKGVWGDVAAR